MKVNVMVTWLMAITPALGFCQDGMDLIDNTKEPPPALSEKGAASMSPEKKAEIRAEISCFGQYLDTWYTDCGRYPTNHEGLAALVSPSRTCKNRVARHHVAALPKNVSGLKYDSKDPDHYELMWVGSKFESGEALENFWKTCSEYKQK